MVGLFVDYLSDIIFMYFPKELPCLEEKYVKVELASKQRVSNVQTEQSKSNCVSYNLWQDDLITNIGNAILNPNCFSSIALIG